jgi:hypothetical protein
MVVDLNVHFFLEQTKLFYSLANGRQKTPHQTVLYPKLGRFLYLLALPLDFEHLRSYRRLGHLEQA